ncbi:MAG: response regulator [Caulobacteraceae bacterium]|nr:response regulator [Caulobacteraceae bacterium]
MSPAEDPMSEQHADAEPLVLVVEDEVLIRLAAADHLRSCGFRVAEAGTAIEAQELILSGLKVDLVFSDINMPGSMNSVGFAQWLHQHAPDVPVILTSGVNSSLEAARRACANVHELTPKPYSYDMISGQIRAVLRARD